MAIFRGTGGAGSANDDVTVTTVTTKASEAAASATAASSSASSAATSATSASNSASTATTKASEASTSKDTATTKASAASTSATAAASSATAAAASAADIGQDIATTDSPTFAGLTINGTIAVSSTVDGRDLQTDGSKLDGIEASATADQSNAEIRTAVEAASNSNVFTEAVFHKATISKNRRYRQGKRLVKPLIYIAINWTYTYRTEPVLAPIEKVSSVDRHKNGLRAISTSRVGIGLS